MAACEFVIIRINAVEVAINTSEPDTTGAGIRLVVLLPTESAGPRFYSRDGFARYVVHPYSNR